MDYHTQGFVVVGGGGCGHSRAYTHSFIHPSLTVIVLDLESTWRIQVAIVWPGCVIQSNGIAHVFQVITTA